MKILIRSWTLMSLCLIMALGETAVPARATAQPLSGPLTLPEMLAQSDLAFLGRVERIEYAFSEPASPELVRIPYTFVTYRVEEVFVGAAQGGTVTLRFIGGFDSGKMLYMLSSQTPQFDLGDRDILFVHGNTKKLCPLVRNADGRLRIIEGKVYSETGSSVILDDIGWLRYGKTFRFPEVQDTTVNGLTFTTLKLGPKALEPPGDGAGVMELRVLLRTMARGITAAKAFMNADARLPFKGPNMSPGPPPASR